MILERLAAGQGRQFWPSSGLGLDALSFLLQFQPDWVPSVTAVEGQGVRSDVVEQQTSRQR